MLYVKNLLLYIISLPLIGVLFLVIIPYSNKFLLRLVALNFACLTFIGSLILWIFFDKSIGSFQFINKVVWVPILNINFIVGIDGISLFFILLTTLLIPICLLSSWDSIKFNLKEFLIFFLFLEFFLIGVFCILDLLLFYIFFFECVLIPMFLIIGIWGSRERKIRAAFFFLYIHYLGQF